MKTLPIPDRHRVRVAARGGQRRPARAFARCAESVEQVRFAYACLVHGHFEAGMVGTIVVK